MKNYSVFTARLTEVSYNNYITSFKAESTEAAKNKVTGLHEIGGLNFNLYYYIIVEDNTGQIVWNQHIKEFKTWIPTPGAETEAELLKIFVKANIILTASILRADHIRKQADKLKAKRIKDVKKWIEASNQADKLNRAADQTESRGRKVWTATTAYQGKYVNWRNLTKDGILIHNIIMNISRTYEANLQAARKLAGI